MRAILPELISNTQCDFVLNRLITDNIIIAFELTHYIKWKRQGKSGVATLKLDMSKTYDRIEWVILKQMMIRLGFCQGQVNMIMCCVHMVCYCIIHESGNIGPIIFQHGIQQGDPLSSFLLIICAKGLSSLINKCEAKSKIHGCRISRVGPSITHLFFTDDCYFFSEQIYKRV